MGPGRTNQRDGRSARALTLRAVVLLAVLAATALISSGCGASAEPASAAGADGPAKHGGTLTIGEDQQPQCLNTWLVCGGMAVANVITGASFDQMLAVDKDGNRAPQMATEIPTTDNGGVVVNGDGTMDVTIHIKPEARWSDQRPITCEDVVFTWKTIMDDRWQIGSRTGYDLVSKIDCTDEHTAVWHFKERYAPFLNIVGSAPLPKHALAGKDFNTFLNDKLSVTSGPFVFDHWDRSVEIVLKRNPHYWDAGADERPWLDEIRYVFIADTNTLKIQLRTGEVDMINPPPDTSLQDELKTMPRAKFQSEPGVYWEQLAFNNAKAPTNDINVRKAIALSVDRQQITDVVLKKQVGVLQSTLLTGQKDYYFPAWEGVKPDARKAKQLLEKSGYQRSGQYYTKQGDILTVEFKSTAGNVLRMKVAQLMQQELKLNGIRMTISMEPAEIFFGQSTIQGRYNIALWAWSSGLDPTQRELFSCDKIPTEANDYAGNNNYRYCDEHVTDLLKQADVQPDVPKRAVLLKEVQVEMAKDMPMLPLFQRPETIAYGTRTHGLDDNPFGSLTWNTADWSVQ